MTNMMFNVKITIFSFFLAFAKLHAMELPYNTQKIIEAARLGNLDNIQKFADLGADCTAALIAAIEDLEQNDPAIVILLISCGADVNAIINDETTLLEEAIRGNKKEIAKVLLDCGADTELFENQLQKNFENGNIPRECKSKIFILSGFGYKTQTELKSKKHFKWVKKHKCKQKAFYRWDLLPFELKLYILSLVFKDITKFINPKMPRRDKSTILNLMIVNKEFLQCLHTDKLLAIILSNAVHDPKRDISSAFVSAARCNNLYAVEAFIISGVKINQQSKQFSLITSEYQIALNCAISNGNYELTRFLISKRADIEARNHEMQHIVKKIPEEIRAYKDYEGITRTQTISAKTEDIYTLHENGNSPLMIAAIVGDLRIAKLLIRKGATIDAKDWKNETALIKAIKHDHEDIVKLLIRSGALIDESHILQAIQCNHEDIAILLIKSSPPQGKYRREIIREATRRKRAKVLSVLIT